MHRLGGGPSHCDNEQRAALDDDDPPQVVLLEMELPTSSTSLYPRIAEGPLKDDDPCCRLCGEACYMQVDMRCKAQAKRHMQVKYVVHALVPCPPLTTICLLGMGRLRF